MAIAKRNNPPGQCALRRLGLERNHQTSWASCQYPRRLSPRVLALFSAILDTDKPSPVRILTKEVNPDVAIREGEFVDIECANLAAPAQVVRYHKTTTVG